MARRIRRLDPSKIKITVFNEEDPPLLPIEDHYIEEWVEEPPTIEWSPWELIDSWLEGTIVISVRVCHRIERWVDRERGPMARNLGMVQKIERFDILSYSWIVDKDDLDAGRS